MELRTAHVSVTVRAKITELMPIAIAGGHGDG